MSAPERYVITLEGKLWNARRRHLIVSTALPHLLTRLLIGDAVSGSAFAAFGIRLTIHEDTDQGDDGPDDLAVRTMPEPRPR